jgi:XTP/dITP diphosphohydrolase
MKKKNIDEILIATSNKGKLREVQSYLSSLNLRFHNLSEFPSLTEPEETGSTFAENASLKARYYADQTKLWTLADDSGLEVEALGGAPGVFSARYAGVGASDSKRIEHLLSELKNVPDEKRSARFVCALAFSNPRAELIKLTTGTCEGRIALEPRGTNGFGYDPAFLPDGYEQTFGELSHEIKQNISHRANALRLFTSFLTNFLST